MKIDWNAIAIIFSNLGALALIGKYLISGVAKSNENIPTILHILSTHTKAIEELFQSRNEHSLDIVQIKTSIECCDACNDHKPK